MGGGQRSPVRIDYRKRVGKRARELGQHFTAAVDAVGREVTVELAAAIGGAAELVALVEDMRARALRGADVNADDLVRLQRLADLSRALAGSSGAVMRLLMLSRSPLNADRNGMRLKSRSISCCGLPSIHAVRV